MVEFKRFIVIRNPASTNAGRLQRRIDELRQVCPCAEIDVIRTSSKEADQRLLEKCADKLGKDTLLCIAAGDGTINSIVRQLLTDKHLPKEAAQTPVLPLWCGNANDLAVMLNGPSRRAHIKNILERGRPVPVLPLECSLTDKDGGAPRKYIAICYASFGASAFAARLLHKFVRRHNFLHKIPGGRLLHEIAVVTRALAQSRRFSISEGDKSKAIYERIFLRGSHFAKVPATPLRLTDGSLQGATVKHKQFFALMMRIAAMGRGRRRNTAGQAEFKVLDKAWAQFDGEIVQVPAGTKVKIHLSDKPFYALSTRLVK